MIEKIFGNVKETWKKRKINEMLERLYKKSERPCTVSDMLYNYDVNLDKKSQGALEFIVACVREGGMNPEFLDIDKSKIIQVWQTNGWTCTRIKTEEEWERIVRHLCKNWRVDTSWGTFRGGISNFAGEDIYMFRKYIEEYTIDNPDSNWDGCTGSHTFLDVNRRESERKRVLGYLQSIDDGETHAMHEYLD